MKVKLGVYNSRISDKMIKNRNGTIFVIDPSALEKYKQTLPTEINYGQQIDLDEIRSTPKPVGRIDEIEYDIENDLVHVYANITKYYSEIWNEQRGFTSFSARLIGNLSKKNFDSVFVTTDVITWDVENFKTGLETEDGKL
ncbi:hypothetical protein 65p129 [Aeromonas phage 65]|uniref:Uncharacterized protein n=2 Tax=Ishigurovirus osborne TaxID=260149 RepID=A0A219YBX3_9CAUD|nr:hypothetical protein ST65p129 [Aeromonas phage 65]ADQ53137.1 hypothetical protein 65p129 [Aeromonas phage 65]APU01514.1 hypothetical protein [Aeromonas phage 65.2]